MGKSPWMIGRGGGAYQLLPIWCQNQIARARCQGRGSIWTAIHGACIFSAYTQEASKVVPSSHQVRSNVRFSIYKNLPILSLVLLLQRTVVPLILLHHQYIGAVIFSFPREGEH